MNEGRYPDHVVNEAVKRIREGGEPKDVADELREKYGYEKLVAKTVKRWYERYPWGKQPKSLPPELEELVQETILRERLPAGTQPCAPGKHEFGNYHGYSAHPYWSHWCQVCGYEERVMPT